MNRRTLLGLLALCVLTLTGRAQSGIADVADAKDVADRVQVLDASSKAVSSAFATEAGNATIQSEFEAFAAEQPAAKAEEARVVGASPEDRFVLAGGERFAESNEVDVPSKKAPKKSPKRVRMAEDATYFEFDVSRSNSARTFHGTPRIVLTGETSAVVYNLWNLPDTLDATVDLDAGTISITPACVYTHSTYGEIWAAYLSDTGYSLKKSITGTINDDGSITLGGWCLVIISGDYKGYGYGFYSSSDLKLPNATMENVHYDGTSVDNVDSVYRYSVYVEQPYDNVLSVANFTKSAAVVDLRLTSDSVVTIAPQVIFTNAMYGNFLCNPASWATSKAAQDGNIVATAVTPTEIDFGNWGVFCQNSTSLRSMGVISSRLIFAEGLFTYPAEKELDWTGEGTESSPWIIKTPEQMLAFSEAVNGGNGFTGKYVALGNDIDMGSITSAYLAVGNATNSFDGNFDGKGYSIKNLTVTYDVEEYCGVFGYADTASVIKDLTVEGLTLTSYGDYAGGVVGYSAGSLSNLKVTDATIMHYASYGGGLVGMYYCGSGFNGGYFSGTLTGYGDTGGCIGMLQASEASNLESHGSLTLAGINSSFNRGFGGVVGHTMLRLKKYAKLTDSYNAALLTSSSSYTYTGGVVGNMTSATMERCYNTGPISVKNSYSSTAQYYGYSGGVAGMIYGGTVKDCYNAGTVINSNASPLVGGFVGYVMVPMKSTTTKDGSTIVTYSYTSSLTNCYNSAQVRQSTNYDVQGFYGKTYSDSIMHNCLFDFQTNGTVLPDSSTVVSKLTKEMTASTGVAGLGASTWTFGEGFYPVLKNLASGSAANFSKAPVTFAEIDNVTQVKSTFKVSTDNDVTWKLYYNSNYVDESNGLTISGDSVTLKNVNSSETLCAFDADGKILKLYHLNTVDPSAWEGSGTEDDPFQIRTKSDMLKLDEGVLSGQAYSGLYFKQMNDIDLGENDSTANFVGVGLTGGKTAYVFGGIFDGDGHSFHNFKVNTIVLADDGTVDKTNSVQAVGLFSMVSKTGEIRNVTLAEDCEIRGYAYSSGIVAVNYGKVYRCKNYATVITATNYAGGIVAAGQAESSIEECYNAGLINASGFYAAGIAAYTGGDLLYNQNDGDVRCDSIYPGTKWANNAYAAGIAASTVQAIQFKGNINTGHITARKYAAGIAMSVSSSYAQTFVNNINYGMVDDCVTLPATRGTMLAYSPSSKSTVENNFYDSQIGYYGAAATATATGLEGKLTREFTAGDAIEGIEDASRFDWTAGLYPVIKAFKDEAPAVAHRKMVVTFGDEQTADDVLNDATLYNADDLSWTTMKGVNFIPSDATLKVVLTEDTTSLRDTLTATVGIYTKVIPLRAMPKMFDGSGTEEDPFRIRTKEDMLKLAYYTNEQNYPFANRYFLVENDIDFDTTEYIVVGLDDATFNAHFDGNGKTFTNINNTVTKTQDCRGMFGNLGPDGVLHDFTLGSGTITGYRYNGAIVGKCYGKVYNVTNYATVTTTSSSGAGAAGIAGQVYEGGSIVKCYNYGTMAPTGMNAAGIAYKIYSGAMVDSCENFANIEGAKTGYAGIVAISAGQIFDCINHGNITSGGSSAGIVASTSTGCVVGRCINHGDITGKAAMAGVIAANTKPGSATADPIWVYDCYNDGDVSGTGNVGGFAGNMAAGILIENCYTTGNVTGTGTSANFGGFVANVGAATDYTSRIVNCYNTGDVTCKSQYTGGFVGKTVSGDEFENCYNTGDVYSTNKFVGGFGGNMAGTAYHCYNTGNVKGDNVGVGGFASIGAGTAEECFNLGDVTSTSGTQNGGVAGGLWAYGQVKMINSYNMGNVKAEAATGGLCGGIYNTFAATNCYNAGNVTVTDSTYLGNIAPNPLQNREGTFTNVYFDTEVNRGMPYSSLDSLCTGLNTSLMTQIDLGEAYLQKAGMYPTLAFFADNELANWFAAVPVFADGDDPMNVNGPFIVGTPAATEWTCSDNLYIIDGTVYCDEIGEGWVKKTYTVPTLARIQAAEGEETTGKVYEKIYYVNVLKTSSGVQDVTAKNILGTVYYNIQGVIVGTDTPTTAGVYVKVTRFGDGSTTAEKVLIK